ncbi:MAG: hypothetical protein HY291_16330 [Planctomycetes bacterium]|nr:hypothetical protein [Planctomycetota bacterium]
MAFGANCDRCGCDLLGQDVRYKVSLDITQAYDPMEISSKDLRRDMRGELEEMIKVLEALPAAETKRIEDEIYSSFCFDLCPACAKMLREDAKAFFRTRHDARRSPLSEQPPGEPNN